MGNQVKTLPIFTVWSMCLILQVLCNFDQWSLLNCELSDRFTIKMFLKEPISRYLTTSTLWPLQVRSSQIEEKH